jgi:tetratricopeptide (TPR) repeat protein
MSDTTGCHALDRRDGWAAAALFAAVFALYARSLGAEFVAWDDPQYVSANPMVQRGLRLESIAWAFRTELMGSWHPLTWLSHLLAVELFGLAPAGHHALNALLHAANSALLFLVLRALTGARWRSALVAALFGAHPLHVESVAWVAERKDVLSTFFGLLALGAWTRFVRSPGTGRYLVAAALFAASLMSKPMLVTLPVLLLLLDYWPLARPLDAKRLLEKLPLFALSAACAAAALATQSQAADLPLGARLSNASLALVAYLGKTLWPASLAMYYPHPYLPESGAEPPPVGSVLVSAALLAGITALVVAARRRGYLPVGWLWYVVSLLPVIGIVQIGGQALADRYTYVPLIGIFVLVVWGAEEIVERLALRRRGVRRAAALCALALLAALAAQTWRQIGTWRDSRTLFEHALAVVPHNPTIRFNLANLLRREGHDALAIAEYRRALEDAPSDARLHVNLANALRAQGDPDAALEHYRAALELAPYDEMANANLASLLRERGELDLAEIHYRRAFRVSHRARIAYNLANLLRERGDLDEAIEVYQLVLRVQPRHARAHNNLGRALEQRGEAEAALRHYERACEIDPDSPRAWRNAGTLSWRLGRRDEAAARLRHALELEPDHEETRALLAEVLAAPSEPSETAGSPGP